MLIESTEALESFLSSVRRSGDNVLALDTEFFRDVNCYYPRLSLIQICSGGMCCVVDVLSGLDLSPLLDMFSDEAFVKVFHDCQQDIACLVRLFDAPLKCVFDTQIAMMFCSVAAYKVGYAKLVKEFCGVDLYRKYQMKRTNWMVRPLSLDQMEYAYNDVRYLRKVYSHLYDELLSSNKLDWFYDEMEYVLASGTDVLANASRRARNNGYGIEFVNLFEWREYVAKMCDVNRKIVLSDSGLHDLYFDLEKNDYSDYFETMLAHIDEDFVSNSFEVLELIRCKNCNLKTDQLINSSIYNDECMRDFVFHLINAFILSVCKIHNISSKFVASHVDIEDCFFAGNYCKIMKGWRYDLFGRYILKLFGDQFEFSAIVNALGGGDVRCNIS